MGKTLLVDNAFLYKARAHINFAAAILLLETMASNNISSLTKTNIIMV